MKLTTVPWTLPILLNSSSCPPVRFNKPEDLSAGIISSCFSYIKDHKKCQAITPELRQAGTGGRVGRKHERGCRAGTTEKAGDILSSTNNQPMEVHQCGRKKGGRSTARWEHTRVRVMWTIGKETPETIWQEDSAEQGTLCVSALYRTEATHREGGVYRKINAIIY